MRIGFSSLYVGGDGGAPDLRVFVLSASGEPGPAPAGKLALALRLAIAERPAALFLDLRGVGAVGPECAGCIAGAKRAADAAGVHLAVIRGASPAYRVLGLADADSLVALADGAA